MIDSDGVLSEITHSTFERAIGGNIEEVLVKNENSHEVERSTFPLISYISLVRNECTT